MCKTIKKAVVGAGLGVATLALLFGTSAKHHVKTAVAHVRGEIQDRVPPEYKIAEARQRVAELEPAILENFEDLARAEFEVKVLKDEIAVAKANLNTQGKEMLALKDGLEDGRLQLTSGVTYTADEVRCDLDRRLETFNRCKETVGSMEQTLKAKVERMHALSKISDEMVTQQKALTAKIEAIESRLAQIKATQASNEFTFDTTPLSEAKKTIADLEKELEIMARKAELEARYVEQGVHVPVDSDASRNLSAEIDAAVEGLEMSPTPESKPAT